MRYAYLATLDWPGQVQATERSNRRLHPEAIGLELRWTAGAATLYASAGTPALDLARDGCIVGDIYFRDGQRIGSAGQLPLLLSRAALRDYVLTNCWGDYILAQPVAGSPGALTVLRSPSHACELQCVYALDERGAFITSDISLPVRLGLYRRRVALDSIVHRLAYPDLRTARTGLAGVSELLPGQRLQLQNAAASLSQDWNPWDFLRSAGRFVHIDQAAAEVRRAVDMTTTAMSSLDRHVLLELSGGLDSSIVATCLRQAGAQVDCINLTAPVPGADEHQYAAEIAGLLGIDLHRATLDFEDAVLEFDLPPALVSPGPGPLQHAVDRHMQARMDTCGAASFFSGAGGDSVFCYLTSAAPAADAYRSLGLRAGLAAIRDIASFHQCTYWQAGRFALRKLRQQKPEYRPDLFLMPEGIQPAPLELHPWLLAPPDALPGDTQRIFELSGVQGFRQTAVRSFERPIRMPLLSQPVIEACLRTPSWMWFEGGQNRAAARKAFADLLPKKISTRKSKGTLTAYLAGVHRRKRRQISHFLAEGRLRTLGLIDPDALRALEAREDFRTDDQFIRLFHLCAIENWLRQQDRFIADGV